MGIKVAKFGGSSLADAAHFRKVKEILLADEDRRIVVPSAPGKRSSVDVKVTDMLYQCNRLACAGKDIDEVFSGIVERYETIASDLELDIDLKPHLDEVRKQIKLGNGEDYAASRGEYLNGILLAHYMGWDFIGKCMQGLTEGLAMGCFFVGFILVMVMIGIYGVYKLPDMWYVVIAVQMD